MLSYWPFDPALLDLIKVAILSKQTIFKSTLGRQFALYIIIFSSFFTFLITAFHITQEYQNRIDLIESRFSRISDSFVAPIALSVWSFDEAQIAAQLKGLHALPDIDRVSVTVDGNEKLSVGQSISSNVKVRQYPLTYTLADNSKKTIGTLTVIVSMDHVYDFLLSEVIYVLVTNGFKTAFVALFIALLVQRLFTSNLILIKDYLCGLDFDDSGGNLVLNNHVGPPNELDVVAENINSIVMAQTATHLSLKENNIDLNKLLHERDSLLEYKSKVTRELERTVEGQSKELSNKISELDFQRLSLDNHTLVSTTDSEGNITYVNDKFCEVSGYSRQELLFNNHNMLNSGEHSQEFFSDLWRTISSGKVWKGAIKNKRKDGKCYWLDVTIAPFMDENDIPVKYVAIRTDITKRIESTQLAENANQAKSEFISNMSHELRTPLNSIIGFSQLLKVVDFDKEYVTETADDILLAGKHLLDLINDILDLATIEAKNIALDIQPVEIKALLQSALSLVDPLACQHEIEINTVEGSVTHYNVLADVIKLKQVVLNLLTNAIKYNTKHGSVTVTYRNTKDSMLIQVSDTGDGLSPEQIERLFIPFTRLGRERGSIQGTGIGLTICKELIEKMGGKIGVDSKVGVGSTFWVMLPLAGASNNKKDYHLDNDKRSLTSPEEKQRTVNILYIEDNKSNQRLMTAFLQKWGGNSLVFAGSAEEGLTLMKSSKPDIILLDIDLPGMNGYELMDVLVADSILSGIPVIAVTAKSMLSDREKAKEYSFVSYITKPIMLSKLFTALDKAIISKSKNSCLD